jgi:hypothetical protein
MTDAWKKKKIRFEMLAPFIYNILSSSSNSTITAAFTQKKNTFSTGSAFYSIIVLVEALSQL